MSDLISKTELLSWIDNWFEQHRYYHPHSKSDLIPRSELKDILDRIPAVDAVPVVRCDDCKYWDQLEPDHPYGYCMAAKHGCFTQNWDIGIYRKQRYDFFCADGEREEAPDASS